MRTLLVLGALLGIGCTIRSGDEGGTAGAGGVSGSSLGGTGGTSGRSGSGSGATSAGTGGLTSGGTGGVTSAGTGGTTPAGGAGGTSTAGTGGSAGAPTSERVIGVPGIAAWDALSSEERAQVNTQQSFFLHQSVGTDLEDGAEAGGFKFEYLASGGLAGNAGLNGGLFNAGNGEYEGKLTEWVATATANQATLRLAIMKLGYADVRADTVEGVKASYLTAVNAIRAKQLRVLHITPPLVYALPEDNAPKMALRSWMLETFANDVVFDLQDIESTNPDTGARCERGGSWEICDNVRSTAGCPSKSQGVDAASGQGHLCFEPRARVIAKAFLYAIRRAEQ